MNEISGNILELKYVLCAVLFLKISFVRFSVCKRVKVYCFLSVCSTEAIKWPIHLVIKNDSILVGGVNQY